MKAFSHRTGSFILPSLILTTTRSIILDVLEEDSHSADWDSKTQKRSTHPSVGVGILSGGVWFLDPCTGPLEFRAGYFSGSWGIWQQCGAIWGSRFSLLENARRAGLLLATCTCPNLPSPGITLAKHETPVLFPETKKKLEGKDTVLHLN